MFPENVFPLLKLDVKALEDEELKKFAKKQYQWLFFLFFVGANEEMPINFSVTIILLFLFLSKSL